VVNAARKALDLIDLKDHQGGHPRKGVVDLIPIHPLTESTSLEECGQLALKISKALAASHSDLNVFHFGQADQPKHRGLVEMRKHIGWFDNVSFKNNWR
jgi:glutamate formiminotransferase